MDQTTKQTALFFGFLAAAMSQVSAGQAAPAESADPAGVHRSLAAGDRLGPDASSAATRARSVASALSRPTDCHASAALDAESPAGVTMPALVGNRRWWGTGN